MGCIVQLNTYGKHIKRTNQLIIFISSNEGISVYSLFQQHKCFFFTENLAMCWQDPTIYWLFQVKSSNLNGFREFVVMLDKGHVYVDRWNLTHVSFVAKKKKKKKAFNWLNAMLTCWQRRPDYLRPYGLSSYVKYFSYLLQWGCKTGTAVVWSAQGQYTMMNSVRFVGGGLAVYVVPTFDWPFS